MDFITEKNAYIIFITLHGYELGALSQKLRDGSQLTLWQSSDSVMCQGLQRFKEPLLPLSCVFLRRDQSLLHWNPLMNPIAHRMLAHPGTAVEQCAHPSII